MKMRYKIWYVVPNDSKIYSALADGRNGAEAVDCLGARLWEPIEVIDIRPW